MKKKDIYEVTLKIVGIIAAWKFIECIIASVVAYILLHCVSTNMNIGMMGVSQTNFSIMYFVFICLNCVLQLKFVIYATFHFDPYFFKKKIPSFVSISRILFVSILSFDWN